MSEARMTHEEAIELAGLYVLDALDPAEEAAVREHLATCPQSHAAFEELGAAVPALIEAELDGLELVEPPAALRDRILAAAAAEPRQTAPAEPRQSAAPALSATGATPAPVAPSTPQPIAFPSASERAARAERRTGALDWVLRIAAVVAIVAAGAYGWNVQRQLDAAHEYERAVAAVVDAGSQPNAKTVVLAAQTAQHGAGIGAVRPDGSVVLALRDLAATSGAQSYTAWVIVGNHPVNVGDFTVDASGIRSVTTNAADVPAGAVIAVTLEPRAGNSSPDGPIVVAGQAAAPPPANG